MNVLTILLALLFSLGYANQGEINETTHSMEELEKIYNDNLHATVNGDVDF